MKDIDLVINTFLRFEVIRSALMAVLYSSLPTVGSGIVRVSKTSQVSSPT